LGCRNSGLQLLLLMCSFVRQRCTWYSALRNTQASFISTAPSCQHTNVYVILQTPALRRFSQNSRTRKRGVCRSIFAEFILIRTAGGGVVNGKCKEKLVTPLSQTTAFGVPIFRKTTTVSENLLCTALCSDRQKYVDRSMGKAFCRRK
jgi:hypothetical protein